MKKSLLLSLVCAGLLTGVPALAQDRACVIEGSFRLLGKTTEIKDCAQAKPGESQADFTKHCTDLASATAALGGKAGNITWVPQCPKPTQGICKNYMKAGRDAYYYKRSADDLKDLPASCKQTGGQWTSTN